MLKNDRMNLKKLITISMGIVGIVLIAYHRAWGTENGKEQLWGVIILILANISSGIGNVYVAKLRGKVNPAVLSSSQMSFGGLVIFIISLFIEGPFTGFNQPLPYFISLGWLSFLSASAFTIWFFLLQRPNVKVSDLNIWKFIIPIFGAILSWIIIPEEKPEIIPIIGMLIIASSLILYNIVNKKK